MSTETSELSGQYKIKSMTELAGEEFSLPHRPHNYVESAVKRILGGCPLSGKSSMCMMCLKYRIILLIIIRTREYETPRTMKTNFIDKTIKIDHCT